MSKPYRHFKCNWCERHIPYKLFGDDKIKCSCGAVYTKEVTVTIKED